MNANAQIKFASLLDNSVGASRMTARERQVALNAMRNGEAIADAIVATVSAVKNAKARLFHKPLALS